MEWLESDHLPGACQTCKAGDCYNCDHAGKRWYLSRKDELTLRRISLSNAIARLQHKIDAIDRELASL